MKLCIGSKIYKTKNEIKNLEAASWIFIHWRQFDSISKYSTPTSIPRKYQPRMRIVGSNIGIELENSLKSLE